jgi:hypothetical protein
VCEKRVVSEGNKHWCLCFGQPVCNTTMSAKDEHVATAGAGEGEDDLEDNTPPESSEEKRVTVDSYTVRRLARFAHTTVPLVPLVFVLGRCSALTHQVRCVREHAAPVAR